MAQHTNEVQYFLVHLEQDKVETFFTNLLLSGIAMELLDPRELGPKWQEISFVDSYNNQPNPESILKQKQIEQVIKAYSNVYSFEEKYETGDINKILENWQEKYLMDAVRRLNNDSIINKKFLQQKSILKKVKNKWQVTILRDLKALYTKYEIEFKLPLIRQRLFKVDKNSQIMFACFVILKKDVDIVLKNLKSQEIDYEITSWTKKTFVPIVKRQLVFNLQANSINSRWSKIVIFVYYLLSAVVIHDIFVGIIILFISLVGYRFELKSRVFVSQIWTGLGAIIVGIIGGSFAGNMLQVLSMSKYFIVKEGSIALLNFLSLFQVVDWTNQNQNFLINFSLLSKSIQPSAILSVAFITITSIIIIFAHVIEMIKDFRNNQFKQAMVRAIFTLTIIFWVLTLLGYAPFWLVLISISGLILYQLDLQITSKLKTFIIGEFGLFGLVRLFIRSLWFGTVFGILTLSTIVFNNINSLIGDNVLVLLIADIIVSLLLWQITAFLVAKALKVNLVDQIEDSSGIITDKRFNPISNYKYWKF